MEALALRLDELSAKVDSLIAQNKALRDENIDLRNRLSSNNLNGDAKVLSEHVAVPNGLGINIAMSDSKSQSIEIQREKLTEIVREIDKCLAILNN